MNARSVSRNSGSLLPIPASATHSLPALLRQPFADSCSRACWLVLAGYDQPQDKITSKASLAFAAFRICPRSTVVIFSAFESAAASANWVSISAVDTFHILLRVEHVDRKLCHVERLWFESFDIPTCARLTPLGHECAVDPKIHAVVTCRQALFLVQKEQAPVVALIPEPASVLGILKVVLFVNQDVRAVSEEHLVRCRLFFWENVAALVLCPGIIAVSELCVAGTGWHPNSVVNTHAFPPIGWFFGNTFLGQAFLKLALRRP